MMLSKEKENVRNKARVLFREVHALLCAAGYAVTLHPPKDTMYGCRYIFCFDGESENDGVGVEATGLKKCIGPGQFRWLTVIALPTDWRLPRTPDMRHRRLTDQTKPIKAEMIVDLIKTRVQARHSLREERAGRESLGRQNAQLRQRLQDEFPEYGDMLDSNDRGIAISFGYEDYEVVRALLLAHRAATKK